MKKIISLLLVTVMVLSFASCMKVNVVIPGMEVNLENTTASAMPENTTAQGSVVPMPEVTTAAPTQENTTAAPVVNNTAPAAKTPLEMSKGELLTWFNTSLNNVKEKQPGFRKAKQVTVADIVLSNQLANSLVGFVKGMLLSEDVETTDVAKGQSCIEIMSPDGERYVSNLMSSDIKDITVTTKGTNYVVKVTIPNAVSPTKDEGAYAKIFNFVTIDDVMNIYAPKVGATVDRKNVKTTFSDCYAEAVISPDGNVVEYHTYVTCVVSLKDASIKKGVTISSDVDFKLVATTDYSNFAY